MRMPFFRTVKLPKFSEGLSVLLGLDGKSVNTLKPLRELPHGRAVRLLYILRIRSSFSLASMACENRPLRVLR